MSCCGQKRAAAVAAFSVGPTSQDPSGLPQISQRPPVTFEYVGATAMTVQGPLTGRVYRFAAPGSQLSVDPRDAASLGAVPRLRRRW